MVVEAGKEEGLEGTAMQRAKPLKEVSFEEIRRKTEIRRATYQKGKAKKDVTTTLDL